MGMIDSDLITYQILRLDEIIAIAQRTNQLEDEFNERPSCNKKWDELLKNEGFNVSWCHDELKTTTNEILN